MSCQTLVKSKMAMEKMENHWMRDAVDSVEHKVK